MEVQRVVFYDGVCGLCNKLVKFLIKKDVKETFRYAALASERAQVIPTKLANTDSLVYFRNDKFYIKSNAGLRIIHDLGGFYKLVMIFWLVPRFIRDYVYDHIAKRRYKRHGKFETCPIPEKDVSHLFLS